MGIEHDGIIIMIDDEEESKEGPKRNLNNVWKTPCVCPSQGLEC